MGQMEHTDQHERRERLLLLLADSFKYCGRYTAAPLSMLFEDAIKTGDSSLALVIHAEQIKNGIEVGCEHYNDLIYLLLR